jgi:hypothetical protein
LGFNQLRKNKSENFESGYNFILEKNMNPPYFPLYKCLNMANKGSDDYFQWFSASD